MYFLLACIVQVANIPKFLVDRWYHSIVAVGAGENCAWIMVVGGLEGSSKSLTKFMPSVVLLELSE